MFNLTGVTVGSGDILMPLIWVSRALALEAWGTPGGVRRALVRGRCHVGSREPSTPRWASFGLSVSAGCSLQEASLSVPDVWSALLCPDFKVPVGVFPLEIKWQKWMCLCLTLAASVTIFPILWTWSFSGGGEDGRGEGAGRVGTCLKSVQEGQRPPAT